MPQAAALALPEPADPPEPDGLFPMRKEPLFCWDLMPNHWEVTPGTEVGTEGWITSLPRLSKARYTVRERSAVIRYLDEESLLSAAPHLAIAMLRPKPLRHTSWMRFVRSAA